MQAENYANVVLARLRQKYADELHTQLKHKNTTELFVAALLSPQCTDKQTNRATKALFSRFRSFDDYANASVEELEKYLKGINYYKTKARHLKEAARQICTAYNGKVPRTLKELMQLQGVGRKVANVILNEAYGINEGIAVDTHVKTVSYRLGLTHSRKPEEIEKDLMRRFDKKDWGTASNALIALGRDTCKALRKECNRCILNDICPSSTVAR
ncbi:MAG: endonuclease III [Candidatus Micrarchaeaceae archaeon]